MLITRRKAIKVYKVISSTHNVKYNPTLQVNPICALPILQIMRNMNISELYRTNNNILLTIIKVALSSKFLFS